MKTLLLSALVVLLTACTAVPVKRNFPAAPESLKQNCPDLQATQPGAQLSDVITTVVNNYALYHECKLKVETWNEWYETQKKIFEE